MRLFLGLSLPDDVRAETERLSAQAARLIPARFSEPCNHHITLAFLGDVPQDRLSAAHGVLAACLANAPSPCLTLEGCSQFGPMQNAILIVRVRADPDIVPLHDALCRAAKQCGLPCDSGPFSPHITLARHAHVTPETLAALMPAPIAFCPAQGHVFLSARDDQGRLRYTPIASASFG